jgi:predicted N-acetyltransferase YhbS
MHISYLADRPESIAYLAPPIAAHWRSLLHDETVGGRTAKLTRHLNRESLPIAWVAHSEDGVLGTAALRARDLDGREDLTPWLGGVFVRPEFRGRGVATALCRVVEEKAWALGFETIYLFTLDQQRLYSRLGWMTLEPTVWRGRDSEIMVKSRNPPGQGR